jgi:pyruvate dehydrogenase E2 component (dihydrolipoamide acetyltransferase)
MADKLLMLALSPTMETGTIAKWLKKEGDRIENGDVLCEVETDKATMEYESTMEGTLLKILVPEGGQAKVGDPIGIIGEVGEDIAAVLQEIEDAKKAAPSEKTVKPELPSEKKEEVPSGAVQPTPATPEKSEQATQPQLKGRVKASPLARKLAQDHGLDIRLIPGSGPGGRVVKRDVEQAIQTGVGKVGLQATGIAMQDQTIPVSEKRKVIARRLAESKYSAPHYYLKLSVEMDGLMEARKLLNQKREQKLSMNAFLIKFAAEALKRHPIVNSTWNEDHIIQHGSIDIGLAVAQPDGLITPVVRNCGNKGIEQIDEELKVLIDKALNNKLVPEEYTGATFTISNLGSFGIEEFTAIINPPGSAILAVGMVQKTPVIGADNNIIVKNMMKLTLSCDHRIIDGAVGAAFLKDLKDMMENPIRTLL